jgi:hypothetical protein
VHIEALTDKAPDMIRFSRLDNGPSPLLSPDEIDHDKIY